MNDVYYDGVMHEMPLRDVQQSKVYRAERQIANWGKDPIGDQSEDAVRDYLEYVCASNAWLTVCRLARRASFNAPRLDYDEHGRGASAHMTELSMTKGSAYRQIMLHELAHSAFPLSYEVAHNWPFVRVYLRLVRRFLGAAVHDDLRFRLQVNRAKLSPKRKSKPLTAARYATLRAQVDLMNAAKRAKRCETQD